MSESEDRIRLEPHWKEALRDEFTKPYMNELRRFLAAEKERGKVIYPRGSEIFAALDTTPLPSVRVVVIGQDPYHGPGQAHGLCFSVQPHVAPPPSLINIFKEINDEFGSQIDPSRGTLLGWAEQGVLLLNSVLTVERGRAGSHQGRGWETFTDRIVEVLNSQCENLVFLLWGSYAQRKGAMVDDSRHCVLRAPHPSPLSAHRGFFGCGHFSQTNRYLERHQQKPIDWFAGLAS
jgi:uracil-DNA glycosylase